MGSVRTPLQRRDVILITSVGKNADMPFVFRGTLLESSRSDQNELTRLI